VLFLKIQRWLGKGDWQNELTGVIRVGEITG